MRLITTAAAAVSALSFGLGSATAATMANAVDQTFVNGATQSNLSEIAAGKLALAKSSSPKVKALGKQLIDDHTKANAKLATIVHAQGMTMPMMPNKMQMATAATLKTLSGSYFNTMWLKTQETGHEQTVALFKSEISSGKNTALVAFASKNLPVIEGHLEKLTTAATTPADAMSQPKGAMSGSSSMSTPMSGPSPTTNMMASPSAMMASPGAMMASPSAMMSPQPKPSL